MSIIVPFAGIAKLMGRTRTQLPRNHMRDLAHRRQKAQEHNAWFREQVRTGLDAANAGDPASAREVEAEAVAWREATRHKIQSAES